MAQGVSLKTATQLIGKAIKKGAAGGSPQTTIIKEGLAISRDVATKELGYDFIGLTIKLFLFFAVALIFSKFMEAVVFFSSPTKSLGFKAITSLLGIKIPVADDFPEALTKLFDGGISGFKYWDIVKIIAMLLVVAEMIRYIQNQPSRKDVSPMTIGLFLGIFGVLAITTIPELFDKLKTTDFNLESMR